MHKTIVIYTEYQYVTIVAAPGSSYASFININNIIIHVVNNITIIRYHPLSSTAASLPSSSALSSFTIISSIPLRWWSKSWWRHQMETFSALLAICAGNSPVPGEFLAQRPVTWSFDVFFDLHLNKRLSKQSWGWWFETLPRPLWRHSKVSHQLTCVGLRQVSRPIYLNNWDYIRYISVTS